MPSRNPSSAQELVSEETALRSRERDPAKILIVDDIDEDVAFLRAVLEEDGYLVRTAHTDESAFEAAARELPDLVLMDVMAKSEDGFDVCWRFKHDPATRLTPLVLLTGLYAREHRVRGINAGADDFLTKPPNIQELRARVRSLVRLKRYTDELDSAEAMLLTLAMTIEARDSYTQGHCRRLAAYATALGANLGLTSDELRALYRGAFLHDLGKICVPDGVLQKAGPLTDQEYILMKQHPVVGESLCGQLRVLRPVKPIVRHHHERLDGSGYPDGLRGDHVPFLAQILSIVDVFDAMTTDRPYRQAQTVDAGCRELEDEAAKGWKRADLVERFASLAHAGRLDGLEEPAARR
jgi:putative two-component system response regulator